MHHGERVASEREPQALLISTFTLEPVTSVASSSLPIDLEQDSQLVVMFYLLVVLVSGTSFLHFGGSRCPVARQLPG